MKPKPRHLFAALFLFAAPMAQAQDYGVTDFIHSPLTVAVTINTTSGESTYANDFQTTIYSGTPVNSGNQINQFQTYCVDIFHYSNGLPGSANPAPVSLIQSDQFTNGRDLGTTSPTAYQLAGLGRAGYLVSLSGTTISTGNGSTLGLVGDINDQMAGLQIAIWKAEYETVDNVLAGHGSDLSSSNNAAIWFSSTTADANALANAAKLLQLDLNGGTAFGDAKANWVSYTTGVGQDQIALPGTGGFVVPSVPEPASIAMWGTAFLVVSGLTYRNKRKATAAR